VESIPRNALVRGIADLTAADPLEFAAAGDPAGQTWIAALPALIEQLAGSWDLQVDLQSPLHGFNSIVIPARRGAQLCVLKVTWPAQSSTEESLALRTWDGNGAVRLLADRTDVGALLLERLDPGRSLAGVVLLEAAEIAGRLLRRLAIPGPPHGLPLLSDVSHEIEHSLRSRQTLLGDPLPLRWLDAAQALSRELGPSADTRLVHADIHYDNVLAGERESWLAIDPTAIVGDPEYAIAELLWTRLDEAEGASGVRRLLDVLIGSGELDPPRARGWALVRAADYWLWGLEHGLTEDPIRCRRILETLTSDRA